ncbi:MAG: hypothetical protein WC667_06515 [Sulfurimonas sp.]|jgi:DNA-binding response OmpR family regulator
MNMFIAAITKLSGEGQVKNVFSCGADYYISKPIQQDGIVDRLKLLTKLVTKARSALKPIKDDYIGD